MKTKLQALLDQLKADLAKCETRINKSQYPDSLLDSHEYKITQKHIRELEKVINEEREEVYG